MHMPCLADQRDKGPINTGQVSAHSHMSCLADLRNKWHLVIDRLTVLLLRFLEGFHQLQTFLWWILELHIVKIVSSYIIWVSVKEASDAVLSSGQTQPGICSSWSLRPLGLKVPTLSAGGAEMDADSRAWLCAACPPRVGMPELRTA